MSTQGYLERVQGLRDDPIWGQLGDIEGGKLWCKDKDVYTNSRLQSYGQCRQQYYFAWEMRLPEESRNLGAWRGNLTHFTIHGIHREKAWRDWEEVYVDRWQKLMDELESDEKGWSRDDIDAKAVEKASDEARMMVAGYVERNHPETLGDEHRVLETEIPGVAILKHPRTGTCYRIACTLDQIRADGDGLNVTDLKTGKMEPSAHYLAKNKQFSIAGLVMRHGTFRLPGDRRWLIAEYPKSMTYYQLNNLIPYQRATTKRGKRYEKGQLRGDPKFDVFRTEADYDLAKAEIFQAIKGIRFKVFGRDEDGIRCSMCRYQRVCSGDFSMVPENMLELADLSSLE